jgi:hypothetical protein
MLTLVPRYRNALAPTGYDPTSIHQRYLCNRQGLVSFSFILNYSRNYINLGNEF